MVMAIENKLARIRDEGWHGNGISDSEHDKKRGKMKGLAMSLELAAVCVCISILVAAAVIVGSSLIKRNKIAATHKQTLGALAP